MTVLDMTVSDLTVRDLDERRPDGRSRRAAVDERFQPTLPRHGANAARNYHAAVALHRHGQLREAAALYRAVLDVNASDFDCLHNLGLLRAQEGRFDDAVGLLRAGARQDPRSVEVHNNLANVLALLRRHDEAVAGFRIAIALKPDFAEAHNNLGNALAVQGATDEAIGHYAQALRLRPDYVDAHVNLANSLQERGRLADAAAHYRQALAVSPGRVEAWLGLGQILYETERYEEAVAAFAKAPELADAWLGRARALRRLRRWEDAIAAYRQALARGGDAEIIGYYLASLGAGPAPPVAPRRLVSTLFDRDSGRYDQLVVGALKYRTPDLLFDAVTRFASARQPDVLDLGCGTGLSGMRFRPIARTLAGVDLSAKMIALARQRQIYDDLSCGELIELLQTQADAFDIAVAADVLVYFGDLAGVFRHVRHALRDGGLFGFSVEAGDAHDFALRSTLRYTHSAAYLRRLAHDHGFAVEAIESAVLRQEDGDDVVGHLVVLRS
jgi:predicted TPR repeat methyltransferase